MNRRLFISELAVLSVGLTTVQAQTAGKTIKPNILFIRSENWCGWVN